MYKKFEKADYENILTLIPKDRVYYGEEITEDYCHDELGGAYGKPDIIVFVKSTEEVSAIMKYAYANNIPVVVRGSGTGLVGAAVALYNGIMICTTMMNNILELDEKNLTLTVEPGVLLLEINKYLEDKNLLYPPDPGEKSATIAGNISTNAGGMRAVKYGVTRDYVRELTLVLPNGEITKVGGKTVKDCSGYDLKGLICGSEGTLAIVTEAVLKLVPKPMHSISLLVPFDTLEGAIESVPRIIASRAIPTAIEFMERETILFAEEYNGKKFPDTSYPAYILMTFDGSTKAGVLADYEYVADLVLNELGAKDVFIVDTDERNEMVWTARGVFLEAIKGSTTEMDECDVVVPRDKVAAFIKYTYEVSEKYGVRMPSFGHAGDGNLHIYICKDELTDEAFKKVLDDVFNDLYNKAEEFGGKVSGEHGIGYAKREYLVRTLGVKHEIMKGIKKVFDEKNILNPDKVI